MNAEERESSGGFGRWIYWYRPKEPDQEDDSAENGVINGVGRKLDAACKQLEDARADDKKERKEELETAQMRMNARIDTIVAQQTRMEKQLHAILAAVGAGQPGATAPAAEPEPQLSEPEPEPEAVLKLK
eukprot:COSAG01_NODE_509_length_16084_cov_18.063180_11_plen_130_part_00